MTAIHPLSPSQTKLARFCCYRPRTILLLMLLAGVFTLSFRGNRPADASSDRALSNPLVTLVVTTTADTDDGICNANCSLRDAVSVANATGGDVTVNFDPSVFSTPQSILLSAGPITITSGGGLLTVNGPGASLLTLDRDQQTNILIVNAGANLQLNGVHLTNARGAIVNSGTLTINSSVVDHNFGLLAGGGINNQPGAILTVNNSSVSDNSATNSAGGGAIINIGGSVLLSNTSLIHNFASGNEIRGGAILNSGGTTTIQNCSLYNNFTAVSVQGQPHRGGAVANEGGTVTITNSTISNNSSMVGAGILNESGDTVLNYVTIANNNASGSGSGGGVQRVNGTVTIANSLIGDNIAAAGFPDVSGSLISQGYNLIENPTGATVSGDLTGNIVGRDPQLMPFENYGGPTNSIALQPISPALDAANPQNYPVQDQRGVARPQDGDGNGSLLPDIGSYERRVLSFVVTTADDSSDGICDAQCSLRDAISAPGADRAIYFDPGMFSTPPNDHLNRWTAERRYKRNTRTLWNRHSKTNDQW